MAICLLAKRKRALIWVLPCVFFVFAGCGCIANRVRLPYPGIFKEEFMMSSAWAGFFAFSIMLIGAILGTALGVVIRKIFVSQ